jgi:hypothetical protein
VGFAMPSCDIIQRGHGDAVEYYLTAVPASGEDPFPAVAHALSQCGASILQERIFAGSDAVAGLAARRQIAYGDLDDGVAPT